MHDLACFDLLLDHAPEGSSLEDVAAQIAFVLNMSNHKKRLEVNKISFVLEGSLR